MNANLAARHNLTVDHNAHMAVIVHIHIGSLIPAADVNVLIDNTSVTVAQSLDLAKCQSPITLGIQ